MKKIFSFIAAAVVAMSTYAGELTVADGSETNASLPVCSYYFDYGFHGQMLYDVEEIGSLAGADISTLTFYSSTSEQSWGAGTVSVKLAEVEDAALSTTPLAPTFTEVFNGSCSIESGELVFALTTPFTYSGKMNLLLDIEWLERGTASYGDVLFYGAEVASAGFSTRIKQGTYTYSSAVVDFLPKTTFGYEGGAVTTCPRPSKLTSVPTPDGAVLSWQGEQGAQHQCCVVAHGADADGWVLLDADVFSYTATGLTAGTTYDFHVRTYCDSDDQSQAAKLSFVPECSAPEKIELSDLTHESVTLAWDAVEHISKYQYVCVRSGETPDWEGVEAVAGTSVSIDTLDANTTYDFCVRSYFSAETQSAATKLTFTTNCVAHALPYVEPFATDAKPTCWTATLWGTSYNYWSVDTYEDHGGDGTYSLRYNARNGSTSDIVTCSIDLSDDALLVFYYRNRYQQSSAITFDVIVLDASNESELLSETISTVSPNESWEEKTIDLSEHTGKTVKVKFCGHGITGTSAYLRLDDIQVVEKPCTTPTALKAAASTTGAVITWKAGGSEALWNLRYKVTADEEWKIVNELEEVTYTLTGCASDTEYEVQVQAACNGGKQSQWTGSVKFTPVCPVPTKLAVSSVEDNRAVATWECPEETFNLQYKAEDDADWVTVENIADKRYELTDLSAGTTYKVRVQTTCGSAYSNAVSFTTKCAPTDQLPYSMDFESVPANQLPECWFVLPSYAIAGVMTMNEGGNKLYLEGEEERWIVLPAFASAYNELTLAFTYSGMCTLEAGYLTEADANTFFAVKALSASPAECDLKDVPAEAKYLAIHYIATSAYSVAYVDDVQLISTDYITAIHETRGEIHAVKRLEDGKLIIEHNGLKYNAIGTTIK